MTICREKLSWGGGRVMRDGVVVVVDTPAGVIILMVEFLV